MSLNIDQAIAERARQQLGLLTRPQARAAGLSSAGLAALVARGRLEPVGTRTLRVAGVPASYEGDVMAACLDVDGVAWLRTACSIHGLGDPRPQRPIEVLTLSDRKPSRSSLAVVHRTTSLPAEDITLVRGLRVASVARTLLGLCSIVPHGIDLGEVEDIVEDAIRRDLASMNWLWWLLEERRCRGRTGVTVMAEVLAGRDRVGPTESWLERAFLQVVEDASLPKPELQQVMRLDGAFVSRVDFRYVAERVVIEVEGKSHLTKAQHARDAEQRSTLQSMGWVVLSFTYDDVVCRPAWVVSVIRRTLASR